MGAIALCPEPAGLPHYPRRARVNLGSLPVLRRNHKRNSWLTNRPLISSGCHRHARHAGGAVAFIFITILLDTLALGLVLPVPPKLVESFVDNDTARAARIFGLLGTAWAAMQFFFSPVLGGLSDRFGRRPVVLLSNSGLALDYVLMALAPSLDLAFRRPGDLGITSASISTCISPTSRISRLRNGAPRCSARSARRSAPDLSSDRRSADCCGGMDPAVAVLGRGGPGASPTRFTAC